MSSQARKRYERKYSPGAAGVTIAQLVDDEITTSPEMTTWGQMVDPAVTGLLNKTIEVTFVPGVTMLTW